jgi:hypothetical protein
MLSGTVDGVTSDETAAKATLADIRAYCSKRPIIYLPSHDPKSAERLHDRRSATCALETIQTRSATSRPPPAAMVAPVT